MAEYFMGQELIQGELPANSPKPPETPPEGVIMTDVSKDGWSRRYIYISTPGSEPEEILISETPPPQKPRVSGAAVAIEDEFSAPMETAEVPEGVILPEGAVLPENAVFSGIPSAPRPTMGQPAAAPRAAGQHVPLVARPNPNPVVLQPQSPPIGREVQVPYAGRQNPLPAPAPQQQTFRMSGHVAAPAPVPTVSIQKAAPAAPVAVQAQSPIAGVEVQVPFIQSPIEQHSDVPSNVRLSNSVEALKPKVVQPVSEAPRPAPMERPVHMMGQIARSLPLATQESRKDSYPVSNPIAPAAPMGGMSQIGGTPGFTQNQIPLRHLGQAAPAAAPAVAPPAVPATAPSGKCPGAVEMPDGTTIEPDHYITLATLCELMPFLTSTLTDLQAKAATKALAGQPIPTQNGYGRGGGGWVGGGGGGPGPTGPAGPTGPVGATGPGSITEPPVVKVDGNFTAGPGAFVPVPGTAVPFSLSAPGIAKVEAIVTLGDLLTQTSENAQIGVRINGTDYPLTVRLIHTAAAGVGEFAIGQSFTFPITLAAGNYVAELLLRGLMPGEFGAGTGAPASVNATPAIPLIITVSHSA